MVRKSLLWLLLAATWLVACTPATSSPTPDPQQLAEARAVKLLTDQEGIYALNLSDLGWPADQTANLRLTQRGAARPFWLEAGGQIVFYAEASTSRYSRENVFILENNAGQSTAGEAIPAGAVQTAPVEQVLLVKHLEENRLYVPQVEQSDPWFWLKIIAPQSQAVEFELQDLAPGAGQIEVALWGSTQANVDPDHSVRIYLNDSLLAQATWDGKTAYNVQAEIPAGLLNNGANQVIVEASGETESALDILELDWIKIHHPVNLPGRRAQTIFDGQGQALVIPPGSQVFAIRQPDQVEQLLAADGALQTQAGLRYILLPAGSALTPVEIAVLQTSPALNAQASQADYLAIGPPDLLQPLQPLLDLRSDQGLKTAAIPLQAIYDQYGHGFPEPQAIRQYLLAATQTWPAPPRYVLLLGDTSYDFLAYQVDPAANRLPTPMIRTVYGGETGSDLLIVQLNDDPWPDLAIGRVPAVSAEQVRIFVNKTLAYEQATRSTGQPNMILAVADGQEAVFARDAESFLALFPGAYQTELLAAPAGATETSAQITAALNQGTLITAYFGHGSINMWGKDRIFTTEASDALQNQQLPIMLNLTCLTGLYTHPVETSMAESLLFNPNGGAVAVLAPTSLTLPSDQAFLTQAFVEALTSGTAPRLGDVTLYAWRQVPADYASALDVMLTYHLFGDPALLIPTP